MLISINILVENYQLIFFKKSHISSYLPLAATSQYSQNKTEVAAKKKKKKILRLITAVTT